MGLRIVTWNVNGIRNPFSYEPWRSNKSFAAMFDVLEADIVIIQETKIQRKDLKDDMVLVPGWDCFFSFPRHEKGKFGVVIYTRQSLCAPIRAEEGLTGTLCPLNSSTCFCDLPKDQQIGGYPSAAQLEAAPEAPDIAADFATLDCEGRCVMLEFPAFVLLGVYAPATRDETRIAYRAGYFNLLDARVRNLVRLGKRVIVAGDLNVSSKPIDVANCMAELKKNGMTDEEYFSTTSRRLFNHLLADGSVWGTRDQGRETPVLHDICRSYHTGRKGMFTHWETKKNARPGNYGSRIDYILCTLDMQEWFTESNIQEGLMGSDHCPVYATMSNVIEMDGTKANILDVVNPEGVFRNGKRTREYAQKDMLPLSGKLIPEFNGRRSIRDMFTRKTSLEKPPNKQQEGVSKATHGTMESHLFKAATPTISRARFSTRNDSQASNQDAPPLASSFEIGRGEPKRIRAEKPHSRSTKRLKTDSVAPNTGAEPGGKEQKAILGFFKPKSPGKNILRATDNGPIGNLVGDSDAASWTRFDEAHAPQAAGDDLQNKSPFTRDGAAAARPTGLGPNVQQSKFVDLAEEAAESRESWAKLFSRPQVPRCEHNEPCKRMLSKKPGMNNGRCFYICVRPLGPSGDKEKGTQWRCRTFIWLRSGTSAQDIEQRVTL